METLITYLVKSAFSLTILYLAFHFLFRKTTHFTLNRIYLAAISMFSLIIPLLQNPLTTENQLNDATIVLQTLIVTSTNMNETMTASLSHNSFLLIIYFTGLFLFFVIFLYRTFRLYNFARKQKPVSLSSKMLFYTDDEISPFSFLNKIFISRNHTNEDLEKIIAHEMVHIMQFHSVDIIFAEMLSIVQWFNPVALLLKKAIKDNHEYIADSLVLSRGTDKSSYQNLILSLHFQIQAFQFTNNFKTSQIKRRIIMMTKMKSGLSAKIRFFVIVPLVVMITAFFACNRKTKEISAETDSVSVPAEMSHSKDEDMYEVADFSVVDHQPSFGKSEDDLMKYLQSNISYPEAAKKKGIQGKVMVGFDVMKTGKVANVHVVKSVHELLDNEAIRVVASMPDWNPGMNKGEKVNVKYVLPVFFKLN